MATLEHNGNVVASTSTVIHGGVRETGRVPKNSHPKRDEVF